MASLNKKRKSKNYPWVKGFEKMSFKMKGFVFFNKKQRQEVKKINHDDFQI